MADMPTDQSHGPRLIDRLDEPKCLFAERDRSAELADFGERHGGPRPPHAGRIAGLAVTLPPAIALEHRPDVEEELDGAGILTTGMVGLSQRETRLNLERNVLAGLGDSERTPAGLES